MTKPFVLFLNLKSGSLDGEQVEQLWNAIIPASRKCAIVKVTANDDFNTKKEEALQLTKHEDAILVIAGGDGTVNSFLPNVIAEQIPIAVLPTGTFNFFARDLGEHIEIEEAINDLLSHELKPTPVAYINEKPFIVCVGLGLYSRIIAKRERHQKVFGRHQLTAVLSAIWTTLRYKTRFFAKICLADDVKQINATAILLSFSQAQIKELHEDMIPKHDHIVAICLRSQNLFGKLKMMAYGLRRTLFTADNVEALATKSVNIECRKRKVAVSVDGELMIFSTPLNIKVGESTLVCMRA